MKNFIRWIIFEYALITGHDEYQCEAGTLKFRFLNWLYDGDAEQIFDVTWPDEEGQ